jgi:hypothetical protein
MKAYVELITAIVILVGTLIGLNKGGVIEVPVINQVPAMQNGGGGGGNTVPTQPIKVAVPDVRGLSLQEAQNTIADRGLRIQRIGSTAIQLCEYESGMVETTLPPAGTEIAEGEGVILYICG